MAGESPMREQSGGRPQWSAFRRDGEGSRSMVSYRVRYRYRLVAAILAVSLPVSVVLALVLTTRASNSLTTAGEDKLAGVARTAALRVESWLAERRADSGGHRGQGHRTGSIPPDRW